ncbi:MAG TPA: hypothetical protein VLQ45_17275 [Thermoanaerobaculia bacterium]|nr:hypothetical protein [Thermoanaerobaculia bacterium]
MSQILARLEAQMALHQEKEAYHTEQEVFHREQRAQHAGEYAKVAQGYEAFKASAGEAAEMAARAAAAVPPPAPPASPREEFPSGKTPRPHVLVAKVVAGLPAGEEFGSARVTSAVNRRFSHALKRPIDPRTIATILRRMAAEGRIRVVRKGTSHQEGTYAKD